MAEKYPTGSSSQVNEPTNKESESEFEVIKSNSDIRVGKGEEHATRCKIIEFPSEKSYPVQRLGAATRKQNEMIIIMQSNLYDDSTRDDFKIKLEEFMPKIVNFKNACKFEEMNIANSDENAQFIEWRRHHVNQLNEFYAVAKNYLKDAFTEEIQPSDSISQISKCSSKLSEVIHNKILEKKLKNETEQMMIEKAAKLKEQELTVRNEYEMAQLKLKMESDQLRVKCEAEALKKLEEEYEVGSNRNSKISSKGLNEEIKLNNKYDDFLSVQNILTSNLLKTQSLAALPKNEPDKFSGEDITRFKAFMLSFERLIEKKCSEDEDKYYYLLNYTTGKANDLVRSCQSDDIGDSFEQAKILLKKNFGNDYQIANKYLSKLRDWPQMKSEDLSSLEDFSLFLTSCYKIMKNMSSLNQLNSWQEIHNIVMKLPYDMRKTFRREAATIIKRGNELNFDNLVNFVNDQIDILKLPVLGDISDRKYKKTDPVIKSTKFVSGSSFLTQENCIKNTKNHDSRNSDVDQNKTCTICICCKKRNHTLDRCFFFLAKSLDDRENFVRKNRLCYGCLATDTHRTKDCKDKLQCKKCKKMHPTSLHRNNPEYAKPENKREIITESQRENKTTDTPVNRDEQMMTVSDNTDRTKCICPAVPVIVRNTVTNKTLHTYLGLDTFCTANYIDQELINNLGIPGEQEELKIRTIETTYSPISVTTVKNLEITSFDGRVTRTLPKLYAKFNWPFDMGDSPKPGDVANLKCFDNVPFNFIDRKIGILIGSNMNEIIKPREIVDSDEGLFACRHLFGWSLNGPTNNMAKTTFNSCFKTSIVPNPVEDLDRKINCLFKSDFEDDENVLTNSVEENLWLEKMKNNTSLINGQFEINLPFRNNVDIVENNYNQVFYKFNRLLKKLEGDEELRKEYEAFMETMISRDFVERVPPDELSPDEGKVWFLSHHGVRHKKKLSLRIVFDCSLKYKGVCLNDLLLKGPNLANSLVGVLLRFRQEPIAISADIEKMFYMVKLPNQDRDFLRFFWIDEQGSPVQYRLTVHLFGAISSPSVANYALKQTANCEDVDNTTKEAIVKNFYVDDLLVSVKNSKAGIELTNDLRNTLNTCNFNITAFTSNSRELLDSLPSDKLSKQLDAVDITQDDLPYERALGLKWSPQKDNFGFNVNIDDEKACTKRGILSAIFSIYDPMFIVSPTVITAKKIFQQTCHLKLGWDDPIPDELKQRWKAWLVDIQLLNNYEIPRCYKTDVEYENCVKELHFFSDGSELAYGSVCYIRLVDKYTGNINCSIVMAKVRLTPLNRTSLKTVPRIELNAAKLSVLLYEQIIKEIDITVDECFFWTDSSAVLNYLNSKTGNFQRFVSNRVAYIRSRSKLQNWRHVPGEINVADVLSRGMSAKKFVEYELWIKGPDFLRDKENNWPSKFVKQDIPIDDSEIKQKSFQIKIVCNDATNKLCASTSDFHKLKLRVAVMMKFKMYIITKILQKKIDVSDIKDAEVVIWRYIQETELQSTYNKLHNSIDLSRNDPLFKLKPFLDKNQLMRVGGRLQNSGEIYDVKHPIVLPSTNHVTEIFVRRIHQDNGHMGREYLLSVIREKYHIIGVNKLIKRVVKSCLICRKVNGRPTEQLMAELPEERVTANIPPFSSTGTDYFGPFLVSIGRGQIKAKRYGVIFSCLASRAVHIEIAYSLDTDGFLNAFRRFVTRRGTPNIMRSDNGTNLRAGNRELADNIKSWNLDKISEFGKTKGIEWKFQPPFASNFGGIFEREIRTIRKILNSLLNEHHNKIKVTDELLHTLMCEVENVMNNRPLTAVTTDIDDTLPITPNHLLRLNNGNEFPPGIFVKSDLYSQKRWRQVQYLADLFWKRWRKEYLPLLQSRQKWVKERRSLQTGDLVLVIDQQLPRNLWTTGKIVSTTPDRQGNVRRAVVMVGERTDSVPRKLERPVNKLILLYPFGEI